MSDRERWIVYPLIFLTLGIALRDKITRTLLEMELIGGDAMQVDLKHGLLAGSAANSKAKVDFNTGQLDVDTIHCRNLVVEKSLHTKQVVATRVAANEVLVIGPDGKLRILLESLTKEDKEGVKKTEPGGRVVVFGPNDTAQVLLSPGAAGGQLSVVDESLRLRLNFGGFREGVILEAQTGDEQRIPLFTLPPALTPQAAGIPEEKTAAESGAARPLQEPLPDDPGPPEPEE